MNLITEVSLPEMVLALNREQSEVFCDPGVRGERQRSRARHQVTAKSFDCMDGRIDIPHLTQTPLGIITSCRNIGGIFDMGWPALSEMVCATVASSIGEGRRCLFMPTYHLSEGDNATRGCKGVGYDVGKGMEHTGRFVGQLRKVFGSGHQPVDIIMVGVETDSEGLILHGYDESNVMRLADLDYDLDRESLAALLQHLYPGMAPRILEFLRRLVRGNMSHVLDLKQANRPPIGAHHNERVLAIGDALDWLRRPNFAITVNSYHPMLDDTIGQAAGIIIENRDAERIASDGALLLTAMGYREQGYQYMAAKEKAAYLSALGVESIHKFHPEVNGFFKTLTGTVDMNTRRFEVLNINGKSA